MRYTNQLGLPETIVKAVERETYDPGTADFTVTQLIDSPQIHRLEQQLGNELAVDVADQVWALMGRLTSAILERGDEHHDPSRRYYRLFELPPHLAALWPQTTVKIGGRMDRMVIADGVVADYKLASVWEYVFPKPDRERQLNLYRWLMAGNQVPIKRLENVWIFRDWSIGEHERRLQSKRDNYPQTQVVTTRVPIWSDETVERYLEERLAVHMAKTAKCSDEDRWYQVGKVAIRKRGRKSAVRLFDRAEDGRKWADDHSIVLGRDENDDCQHWLEQRPPLYNRCRSRPGLQMRSYCPVSAHCEQWKSDRVRLKLNQQGYPVADS